MYKNILVGFDGSKQSEKAVSEAAGIAKAVKAGLAAIFVAEQLPLPSARDLSPQIIQSELAEMGKLELKKAEFIAKKAGVRLVKIYAHGDPAMEVLRHAEKGGFDLVVVGVRSIGGVRRLLLGSVSGSIVHKSRCAVLVVK